MQTYTKATGKGGGGGGGEEQEVLVGEKIQWHLCILNQKDRQRRLQRVSEYKD